MISHVNCARTYWFECVVNDAFGGGVIGAYRSGGCVCSRSQSIDLTMAPCFEFSNMALSSASLAEVRTFLIFGRE